MARAELRHAADSKSVDYGMVGFDLLDIAMRMCGKKIMVMDSDTRHRYIDALTDAAMLCFELQDLKVSMIDLYKRIEGIK